MGIKEVHEKKTGYQIFNKFGADFAFQHSSW